MNLKKNKKDRTNLDYINLMLVPDKMGEIKSLRLNKQVIFIAIATFLSIFTVISVVAYRGIKLETAFMNEIDSLKLEKSHAVDELSDKGNVYDEKIKDLEDKSSKIEEELKDIKEIKSQIDKEISSNAYYQNKEIELGSEKILEQESHKIVKMGLANNNEDFLEVENFLEIIKNDYQILKDKETDYKKFTENTPKDMPINARISSDFGGRQDPFSLGAADHKGIDFSAKIGTEVSATAAGIVKFSGVQSGFGNIIIIDHKNGFETYYAHNSELLLSVGDEVEKGDKVALSGNSGRSTGPHLHYEVRFFNIPQNPFYYFYK